MADQLEFTAAEESFSAPSADLPYQVVLELAVEDPDTIAELCQHTEGDERLLYPVERATDIAVPWDKFHRFLTVR